ncbi:MAG: hypothetical protein COU29_04500 [Candidatus Magasanikbacteria bacterium CG10_big_fil_rev_8_21_14_0_10_36_32]|uniref:Uncharacterized protein n=1 Tax=Candidatus Magasanikbacteria bacterium CG10_big_fil_rev_8_21_14_0_10_36_32 TaxID=1974646 RepID=A0A2M6W5F0_9BACT|nr:MAG: hypothetical protein COU29_04500 [Candidatus Magasanikbacteria bacterium CG10_big_fil_rev_8_21_14_0_10_36_32]
MVNNAESYTKRVVEETQSEKEKQLDGVRRAFQVAFDEYAEKQDGNLPDLTESSVEMFVKMRPALDRALGTCKLINSTDWAVIALSVLQERMLEKKNKTEE